MRSSTVWIALLVSLCFVREQVADAVRIGCLASNASHIATCGANPCPQGVRPTEFLHFPKAGTSFCASVGMFGGREYAKDAVEDNHVPLRRAADAELVGAMFRQPEERLLSAYRWLAVQPRCCGSDWGWTASQEARVKAAAAQGQPPDRVLGPFVGCQVAMVLGFGCMSAVFANATLGQRQAATRTAMARVSRFRFVGIQREWQLSICLFNKLTTGLAFVTRAQLKNMRPTSTAGRGGQVERSAEARAVVNDDLSGLPMDSELDGPLYKFALARFWSDVRKYGVDQSGACPLRRRRELRLRCPLPCAATTTHHEALG